MSSLYNINPNRIAIASALETELAQAVDPLNPQVNATFNALLRTATGKKFVNWVAAVAEFSQFSVSRAVEEVNFDTAELDASIRTAVRSLGVRMARKLPAFIDVTLTRLSGATVLNIPKFTPISGDGKTFYNREPILFGLTETVKSARLYVGSVYTVSFPGNNTDFQTYVPVESDFTVSDGSTVYSSVVSFGDIIATINGTPIKVVRDGIWNYGGVPAVQDQTLADGSAYFIFGTSQYGAKPRTGDVVAISYAVTQGSADNSPLFDGTIVLQNFPQVVVSYSPTGGGIQGGSNETPVSNYKAVGPLLFATFGRCVNGTDHNAIAADYPGVIDAIITGQKDFAPNDRRYMNVQRVTLLKGGVGIDPNDYTLTGPEYLQFVSYYNTKRMDNLLLERVDPTPSKPPIDITLICASYADLSLAREAALQAIQQLFLYQYGSLKGTMYLSDISDAARYAQSGIKFVKINSPTRDISSFANTPLLSWQSTTGGSLPIDTYNYAVVAECGVYDGVSYLLERSSPSVRISFQVSTAGDAVLLQWKPVVSAVNYLIFGRGVGAASMGLLATVPASQTTYVDTGVGVPNMGDLLSAVVAPTSVRFPQLDQITITAIYEDAR